MPEVTRVPLVPETVLRAHDAHVGGDTRFRSAARLLTSLWRRDAGLPLGTYCPGDDPSVAPVPLDSRLHPDAAQAGANFVSPEVHALVRRELALREKGAAIDEDRLFANALSSMPLCFIIFGPLTLDPTGLGTRLFQRLLPGFVAGVQAITFETSPGRRDPRFLDDGTAFDAVLHVTTPDSQPAIVFEVKYSEGVTGRAARHRPCYDEASLEVRLFRDPHSPVLRSLALEQLWREHMLAQLAVDRGLTGQAHFVAIGPQLNRRVRAAYRCYSAELLDPALKDTGRVGFTALTLEAVVLALGEAGAPDLAHRLWGRYLDFGRVLRIALARPARPARSRRLGIRSCPRRDGPSPPSPRRTGRGLVRRRRRRCPPHARRSVPRLIAGRGSDAPPHPRAARPAPREPLPLPARSGLRPAPGRRMTRHSPSQPYAPEVSTALRARSLASRSATLWAAR
jgi:PD-(D/E)XK nuclease superfamily protein